MQNEFQHKNEYSIEKDDVITKIKITPEYEELKDIINPHNTYIPRELLSLKISVEKFTVTDKTTNYFEIILDKHYIEHQLPSILPKALKFTIRQLDDILSNLNQCLKMGNCMILYFEGHMNMILKLSSQSSFSRQQNFDFPIIINEVFLSSNTTGTTSDTNIDTKYDILYEDIKQLKNDNKDIKRDIASIKEENKSINVKLNDSHLMLDQMKSEDINIEDIQNDLKNKFFLNPIVTDNSLFTEDDKLIARKNGSSYCCIVGSKSFSSGVHTWRVRLLKKNDWCKYYWIVIGVHCNPISANANPKKDSNVYGISVSNDNSLSWTLKGGEFTSVDKKNIDPYDQCVIILNCDLGKLSFIHNNWKDEMDVPKNYALYPYFCPYDLDFELIV